MESSAGEYCSDSLPSASACACLHLNACVATRRGRGFLCHARVHSPDRFCCPDAPPCLCCSPSKLLSVSFALLAGPTCRAPVCSTCAWVPWLESPRGTGWARGLGEGLCCRPTLVTLASGRCAFMLDPYITLVAPPRICSLPPPTPRPPFFLNQPSCLPITHHV